MADNSAQQGFVDRKNFPRMWNHERAFLIPQELRALRQWVCWKFVWRNGSRKPTKVPIAAGGRAASSTNPDTWRSFEEATDAYEANHNVHGIGFVFAPGSGYVGIDLDECFVGAELHGWAKSIVDSVLTYTERSPSGAGLHLILRGDIPYSGRRHSHIEIYKEARFFTMTGDVWRAPDGRDVVRDVPIDVLRATPGVRDLIEPVNPERRGLVRMGCAHDVTARPWEAIKIAIDPDAVPPSFLPELLEYDQKLKLSWERRRTDLKDDSASGYCQSLANLLVGAGWNDQDIADTLVAWRRAHGAQRLDAQFFQRTILHARESASAYDSPSRPQEDLTGQAEAAHSNLASMDLNNTPARDICAEVANAIGIPLVRWIQSGLDDAQFSMELLNGRRIQVGKPADVLSQLRWRDLRLAYDGGMLMPMNKLRFKKFIEALQKILEVYDDEDSGPQGRLEGYLREYMRTAAGDERWPDAWACGRPFLRNGVFHINATELSHWIRNTHRDGFFSRATLIATLRNIDFEVCGVNHQITKSSKREQKKYWRRRADYINRKVRSVDAAVGTTLANAAEKLDDQTGAMESGLEINEEGDDE
jgi:hypothetical protein